MSRQMLINLAEGQECRIAITEQGNLEEFYTERASLESRVGNIYKGRVVNIESGIQAAFVDFGSGRNGFLHISDLHPRYFGDGEKHVEKIGRKTSLKSRPLIQRCLGRGRELLVQVTKDPANTKGPTVTTYLSVAGRFLVMMPWMRKHGVSQKIDDPEERKRLADILQQCNPPKAHGFIIRTAGQGCSKKDIQNDLKYLLRLWAAIVKRSRAEGLTVELYQESDLVIRVLRDVFDNRITRIMCDSELMVRKIKDFLRIVAPRHKCEVTIHGSKVPLFYEYGVEDKVAQLGNRTVTLKDGGSIAIDQTEAIVAIDVNSGRYRDRTGAEQTAYRTNMRAAAEIARQLRLRDLGGLIIIDFIDMRSEKNRRDVEQAFRAATKTDRARYQVLKISRFGVVEMTRQRMRSSLRERTHSSCPYCGGTGFVMNEESQALEIIRFLNLASCNQKVRRVEILLSPQVADYLQNRKRALLLEIEKAAEMKVLVRSAPHCAKTSYEATCYDGQGGVIEV